MDALDLLFLGTGTSAGIPMIGCDCPVCTSPDPHDRRMRPSVVISYNGARVLVDTTPELRLQCVANGVKNIDAVVFTHAHADHIMGLDDVRRFNAIRQGPLDIWGDEKTLNAIRGCFSYAFRAPDAEPRIFRPYLQSRTIDGPFSIAGAAWTPIPLMHGAVDVLGFRIGRLAYCTDVSEIPESSYALLHDLDVLVLDALQWKKHPTHLSVDEAIAAAHRIEAKQTLFTHIAHAMAHEETNRALPTGMRLAYDGERIAAGLH